MKNENFKKSVASVMAAAMIVSSIPAASVSAAVDFDDTLQTVSMVKAATAAKPTVSAVIPGNKCATINWTPAKGATAYKVYWKSSKEDWKTAKVSRTTFAYTATGLTNDRNYEFAVKAAVNGQWTTIASSDKVVKKPTSKVTKPIITSAVADDDQQVTLKWSTVKGATAYRVAYKTSKTSWKNVAKVNGTSYSVKGLTNGTNHAFVVQALVNGKWTVASTNEVVKVVPRANNPVIKTAEPGDGSVALAWNAVSGASGYKVCYKLAEGGSWTNLPNTKETSCTVEGLENDQEYAFVVKAAVAKEWTTASGKHITNATPTGEAAELIAIKPSAALNYTAITVAADTTEDKVAELVAAAVDPVTFVKENGDALTTAVAADEYKIVAEKKMNLNDTTDVYSIAVTLTEKGAGKYTLASNGEKNVTVTLASDLTAITPEITINIPASVSDHIWSTSNATAVAAACSATASFKNASGATIAKQPALTTDYTITITADTDAKTVTATVALTPTGGSKYTLDGSATKTASYAGKIEKTAVTATISAIDGITLAAAAGEDDIVKNIKAAAVGNISFSGGTPTTDEYELVVTKGATDAETNTTVYTVKVTLTDAGKAKYTMSDATADVNVIADSARSALAVTFPTTEVTLPATTTSGIDTAVVNTIKPTVRFNGKALDSTLYTVTAAQKPGAGNENIYIVTVALAGGAASQYTLTGTLSTEVTVKYETAYVTISGLSCDDLMVDTTKTEAQIIAQIKDNATFTQVGSFAAGDYEYDVVFKGHNDVSGKDEYTLTLKLTAQGAAKYELNGTTTATVNVTVQKIVLDATVTGIGSAITVDCNESKADAATVLAAVKAKQGFGVTFVNHDNSQAVTVPASDLNLTIVYDSSEWKLNVGFTGETAKKYSVGANASNTLTLTFADAAPVVAAKAVTIDTVGAASNAADEATAKTNAETAVKAVLKVDGATASDTDIAALTISSVATAVLSDSNDPTSVTSWMVVVTVTYPSGTAYSIATPISESVSVTKV